MNKLAKVFVLLIVFLAPRQGFGQEDSTMYAHYINVGQAAAVLLEFPCGAILIDAGAQDDATKDNLLNYLDTFFQRRKDLNRTLALVMVTHPHIDHNKALEELASKFRIERYIDDGLTLGSGRANQKWMQSQVVKAKITYEPIFYEDIVNGGNKRGKTDTIIDPINCTNGDPKIIVYSGAFKNQPEDWTETDFKNYNNHSLVIKILFGKSSFLFTGDLETKGIKTLLNTYSGTAVLDADVLMVGHHGAANATTEDYLTAVTPKYAIISCGEWDFGKGGTDKYTTYFYGHPRVSTIQMLEEYVSLTRPVDVLVKAADGVRDFRNIHERKAIYSTSWDHTIIVRATTAGKYSIKTDN